MALGKHGARRRGQGSFVIGVRNERPCKAIPCPRSRLSQGQSYLLRAVGSMQVAPATWTPVACGVYLHHSKQRERLTRAVTQWNQADILFPYHYPLCHRPRKPSTHRPPRYQKGQAQVNDVNHSPFPSRARRETIAEAPKLSAPAPDTRAHSVGELS